METAWDGGREYYVSYSSDRAWDEARRHGYVRGGDGLWYSRTLKRLRPGNRIWVRIPRVGYVGVGLVLEAPQPTDKFTINGRPAVEVLRPDHRFHAQCPDRAEYFVRVYWLDTREKDEAFNEPGLFANQNTACRPTAPNWDDTVERLKAHFTKWNGKAEP